MNTVENTIHECWARTFIVVVRQCMAAHRQMLKYISEKLGKTTGKNDGEEEAPQLSAEDQLHARRLRARTGAPQRPSPRRPTITPRVEAAPNKAPPARGPPTPVGNVRTAPWGGGATAARQRTATHRNAPQRAAAFEHVHCVRRGSTRRYIMPDELKKTHADISEFNGAPIAWNTGIAEVELPVEFKLARPAIHGRARLKH